MLYSEVGPAAFDTHSCACLIYRTEKNMYTFARDNFLNYCQAENYYIKCQKHYYIKYLCMNNKSSLMITALNGSSKYGQWYAKFLLITDYHAKGVWQNWCTI